MGVDGDGGQGDAVGLFAPGVGDDVDGLRRREFSELGCPLSNEGRGHDNDESQGGDVAVCGLRPLAVDCKSAVSSIFAYNRVKDLPNPPGKEPRSLKHSWK